MSELPEFVDAHCHVDLYDSPHAIASTIKAKRIHTIAVTNAPFVFEFTKQLAAGSQFLYPAVGLHPELVADHASQLNLLRKLIPETRFIGEVGLDYVTQDAEVRRKQREVFQQVLNDCAVVGARILTVHARRSSADVIDMVGNDFPGKVILHWFSGTQTELRRAINYGLHFSVNGAMFQSKSGHGVIAAIPKDRLLTETDGPFTKHGKQRATPESVINMIRLLSDIWAVSAEDAAKTVLTNFYAVAGLA